jgi:hypothetical protein
MFHWYANFHHKRSTSSFNLSHTKRTQTYTRSIEMNFLTLSYVKRASSVNSFTCIYQLSWQLVLSFPNFYLSAFSTLKEHRQDSYLIHGIHFYVRSFWNSTFFGNSTNCLSPFTVNNVIFTALSSKKYCLPSRRSFSKLSFLSENLLCHFYTDERLT